MYTISKTEKIEFKNAVSCRFESRNQSFESEYEEVKRAISKSGASQTGNALVTVFSVNLEKSGPVFSLEIIVPVDRKTELSENYKVFSPFSIENALILCSEYRSLGSSDVDILIKYMTENDLIPATSRYDSVMSDPEKPDRLVVKNMYIGVKG